MHQLLLGAETKTEKKEEKAEKVFFIFECFFVHEL